MEGILNVNWEMMQMNNRQCGSPLIDYVSGAAKARKRITQIICSTNHDAISSHCESSNVEIHKRSLELAKDDTPIIPVLTYLLNHYQDSEGIVPLAVVLDAANVTFCDTGTD